MSGYTLSYRDKWHHPAFRNLLEAGIWSWMCDTAVWKKTKIRFNGILVELERGQLATSRRFISEGFGIGEQVTRTFLENLENQGMINQRVTRWGTVITICNYDKYQLNESTGNPPTNPRVTHDQPTGNPNKNEGNKGKKGKEVIITPPDGVSQEVWDDFCTLRKKKDAPITKTAIKGIIREAAKAGWALEDALSEVCARGWQSFKAEYVTDKKGTKNETNSRNPAEPNKLERAKDALNRGRAAYEAQLQREQGMGGPALPPARPVISDFQRIREAPGIAGSDLPSVCEDFEPIPD